MCSCTCKFEMGCKILTLKWNANDSLFTKRFCSTVNYYSDTALNNSVQNYLEQYELTAKLISSTDSIYESDEKRKLSCKEKYPYVAKGYYCVCAK